MIVYFPPVVRPAFVLGCKKIILLSEKLTLDSCTYDYIAEVGSITFLDYISENPPSSRAIDKLNCYYQAFL